MEVGAPRGTPAHGRPLLPRERRPPHLSRGGPGRAGGRAGLAPPPQSPPGRGMLAAEGRPASLGGRTSRGRPPSAGRPLFCGPAGLLPWAPRALGVAAASLGSESRAEAADRTPPPAPKAWVPGCPGTGGARGGTASDLPSLRRSMWSRNAGRGGAGGPERECRREGDACAGQGRCPPAPYAGSA